jgi:hypothetical protein
MKRFSFKPNSGSKGQSFVELSLVVFLLILLLAGIAEFGVLLNRYLNIVDGSREAARYAANYDPFAPCAGSGTLDVDGICSEYYQHTAQIATEVISPLKLDTVGKVSSRDHLVKVDDIVISNFVVTDTHFCRYPSYENGWSWREHIEGYADALNHHSEQSSANVQGRMDPNAPPVSLTLVEMFYNYPQTLKAPFYDAAFPDPVPVYTYAIMPLKNVTPLNCP